MVTVVLLLAECPIIRHIADIQGKEVYIILHQSEAFARWRKSDEENAKMAVMGISCVATLIAGGWKAKNLGIPGQCVLLNHCGCLHWHKDGVVTGIQSPRFKASSARLVIEGGQGCG